MDPAKFERAWRVLLTLVAIWAAGNLTMAVALWRQAQLTQAFWNPLNTRVGSTLHTPLVPVAGASVLLVFCGLAVGVTWLATFGVRRGGRPLPWVALGLCVLAVAGDGFLLVPGPFAVTRWWGRSIYAASDQVRLGTGVAAGVTLIAIVIAAIGAACRRKTLGRACAPGSLPSGSGD
ncbi:MAG TPA: hypothetical protein VME70_06145 [Mycobacteriales bacterium]|nr:hypothetical protein [Mycobacteriales bacterium]